MNTVEASWGFLGKIKEVVHKYVSKLLSGYKEAKREQNAADKRGISYRHTQRPMRGHAEAIARQVINAIHVGAFKGDNGKYKLNLKTGFLRAPILVILTDDKKLGPNVGGSSIPGPVDKPPKKEVEIQCSFNAHGLPRRGVWLPGKIDMNKVLGGRLEKSAFFSTLVHEFVHVLETQRVATFNKYNKQFSEVATNPSGEELESEATLAAYYNAPWEYSAYVTEMFSKWVRTARHKDLYKPFQQFKEAFVRSFLDYGEEGSLAFLFYLNEKNQKRFDTDLETFQQEELKNLNSGRALKLVHAALLKDDCTASIFA